MQSLEEYADSKQDSSVSYILALFCAEKSGTRSDAIAAWAELKARDIPKDYMSWLKARRKRGKGIGDIR
jgi:hypothetical protein